MSVKHEGKFLTTKTFWLTIKTVVASNERQEFVVKARFHISFQVFINVFTKFTPNVFLAWNLLHMICASLRFLSCSLFLLAVKMLLLLRGVLVFEDKMAEFVSLHIHGHLCGQENSKLFHEQACYYQDDVYSCIHFILKTSLRSWKSVSETLIFSS